MPETLPAIAIVAALMLAGLTALSLALAWQAAGRASRLAASLEAVSRQLDQVGGGLGARLDGATGELNRTLLQSLQQVTEGMATSIGRAREDTRARIDEKFVEVTERLGDLRVTNERIMEFSRSLDDFQRILQSPKMRGDFGEFTLEQMLAELIPAESYDTQAALGGVRVDALIRTPHGALPVDSKFPLDNFRRALDAVDQPVRDAAMKAFGADVRARVDEIAQKYIVPPLTLELALMFVPAENVYYELLSRPDLLEYSRSRRVVPVSPNTMYAYLQALAMGFRGMRIQQDARRVEQILGDLGHRFGRFREHFAKIGRHLDLAQAQFGGAIREVDRLQSTLEGLRVGRFEPDSAAADPEPEPSEDRPASKGPSLLV